jgi:hypothetical protein
MSEYDTDCESFLSHLLLFCHSDCYIYSFQKEDVDSEDDKSPEEKYMEEMSKVIPQGTDKTPEVLDSALKGLSARSVSYCLHN